MKLENKIKEVIKNFFKIILLMFLWGYLFRLLTNCLAANTRQDYK